MAETLGTLADKIAIFELKRFHMAEQLERADASAEHKKSCREKLSILTEQRDDLAEELSGLYDDIASGRKKIKLYRQFKMYNDPEYKIKK